MSMENHVCINYVYVNQTKYLKIFEFSRARLYVYHVFSKTTPANSLLVLAFFTEDLQ